MNLDSPAFWIAAFSSLLAIAAGFTAFSRWCYRGPAVPAKKLSQLRVGMTSQDVKRLLGEPRLVRDRHGSPAWRYGHRLQHYSLHLQFGADDRLAEFKHVFQAEPNDRESTGSP